MFREVGSGANEMTTKKRGPGKALISQGSPNTDNAQSKASRRPSNRHLQTFHATPPCTGWTWIHAKSDEDSADNRGLFSKVISTSSALI